MPVLIISRCSLSFVQSALWWSKAYNELISLSHDPTPRLTQQAAQCLAVALRPISPHCQTVVSRKRETKAETEGARRI